MTKVNIGLVIKCADRDDAVEMMRVLAKDGICTDFVFERNGKEGIWLEIKEAE